MIPTKKSQEESLEILRELLKPGDTVYVLTTQVARSGMSRRVRVLIPRIAERTKDYDGVDISRPFIRDITWLVGRALRWQLVDDGSWELRVDGTGMDMHFYVVYSLSRTLFAHLSASEVELASGTRRRGAGPGYLLVKESL